MVGVDSMLVLSAVALDKEMAGRDREAELICGAPGLGPWSVAVVAVAAGCSVLDLVENI